MTHHRKSTSAPVTWLATALVLFAGPLAVAGAQSQSAAGTKPPKDSPAPVVVVNDPTQVVPVSIAGTPTVNIGGTPTVNANVAGAVAITGTPTVDANVSGTVGITGTPTVNVNGPVGVDVLSNPGAKPGFYFASCVFNSFFCQDGTIKSAPPGMAFKIEHVTGEMFNSSSASANIPGRMSLQITTPGYGSFSLSTQLPVPCAMAVSTPVCTANPGIYVTEIGGIYFQAAQAYTGSARVVVYYTLVDLAP